MNSLKEDITSAIDVMFKMRIVIKEQADRIAELEAALQKRVAELEGQNEMLRHATDKLRAMLTKLNAKHEPLQRAFVTAVELLNDAALEGGKDEW